MTGAPYIVVEPGGDLVDGPQSALDLIGATYGGPGTVAVPVERFDPRFFDLRSGVAGEVLQKFVNYRVRLVVVGDVSVHVGAGNAFRDLVRECNRGRDVWFVADLAELRARLTGRG